MDILRHLAPVSDAYASLPVGEAFDWSVAGGDLGTGEWYMVAFRSIRRHGADEARLAMYDESAHQEAATAPGFVHYFKGPMGPDGSCLSFCLWADRADARSAAGRPAHVEAVGLLDEMYESYRLEFLRVRRLHDRAPLEFEPWFAAPPVHDRAGRRRRPSPRLPARRPPLLTAVTAAEGGLRSFDPRLTIGRLVPGLLAAIAVAAVARLVSAVAPVGDLRGDDRGPARHPRGADRAAGGPRRSGPGSRSRRSGSSASGSCCSAPGSASTRSCASGCRPRW